MVASFTHSHGFTNLDMPGWLSSAKVFFRNFYELLLTIAFVFIYTVYIDYQHDQRMALISEPAVNDFYFVDYYQIDPKSDHQFRYLPIRVMSIEGQQVTFKVGNIGHSEKVSITKHVKLDAAMHRNFYRLEKLQLSRQQLQSMAEQDIIYDIARPENIFVNGWVVMELHELIVD
ncbi:MAG: hypothetical protein Alis3KO_39950 [Aliiglaciecola sp.]|uniref:hypothetical protein n=1 Tax=Aliiglaciecola sp. M165 TaxID=2593649 RepID=UPI00117F421B|nr:hypothetical protein [Aliiglaciecola sp. M165]TRY33005.1 hypothetical protein FM019_03185 [Aliiglaciecola sp. M165]